MKKSVKVDNELLKAAKAACGALTDIDVVRFGLEELVRNAPPYRPFQELDTKSIENPVKLPRPIKWRGI
jgi:hypothetical protein